MRRLAVAIIAATQSLLASASILPVPSVDAQLMPWAILPRDDEMPPGFTYNPTLSRVEANGAGVLKVYDGAYGYAWNNSADLFPSEASAIAAFYDLPNDLTRTGHEITSYVEQESLGATSTNGRLGIWMTCFRQGRWIGCVSQMFPLFRGGDRLTHESLTRLMWRRAITMP